MLKIPGWWLIQQPARIRLIAAVNLALWAISSSMKLDVASVSEACTAGS